MLKNQIESIVTYSLLWLLFLSSSLAFGQQANNACSGAVDLSDQLWHSGDNTLANADCAADINSTNCNTPYQSTNMCPAGFDGTESSLWYTFTVPTDQVIYIDFQNIACSPASFFNITTALQGFLMIQQGAPCLDSDLSDIYASFSASNANNVNGQMTINAVGGQLYHIMIDTKKNSFTTCGSGCVKPNDCHAICTFEIRLRTNTPTPIKDFNVSANNHIVHCDWFYDFQENYSHFRIERRKWNRDSVIVAEAPVQSFLHEESFFHFQDYTVYENGEYIYTLYGSNDGQVFEGVASRMTSVQDIQDVNAYIIPNPAHNVVKVMLQNDGGKAAAFCEIYSSSGTLVTAADIEASKNFVIIDTSTYPPGIYYMKIVIGNKIIKQKLILY